MQYNSEDIPKLYESININIKEIDTKNGTTEFSNLKGKVDKSSFHISCSGSPSTADQQRLNEINNGTPTGKQNTTIFYLL